MCALTCFILHKRNITDNTAVLKLHSVLQKDDLNHELARSIGYEKLYNQND